MPKEKLFEIIGVGTGIAVLFTVVAYPVIKFLFAQWFRGYQNNIADEFSRQKEDIKEVKELMSHINVALTDHMREVYRKIDDINSKCAERGERIGILQGRINGGKKSD